MEERRLDADPRVEDVICAAVSVPPAAAAVSVFGDAAVVVQVTGVAVGVATFATRNEPRCGDVPLASSRPYRLLMTVVRLHPRTALSPASVTTVLQYRFDCGLLVSVAG